MTVKDPLVMTRSICSCGRRIQTEAGQHSTAMILKDAGQQHSLLSPFVLWAPRPHQLRSRYAGSSKVKAAKVTGFGNGNSEQWIVRSSSIRTNTGGRGFR